VEEEVLPGGLDAGDVIMLPGTGHEALVKAVRLARADSGAHHPEPVGGITMQPGQDPVDVLSVARNRTDRNEPHLSAVGRRPGRRHHPRDEGRLYGVAERVDELLVLDHFAADAQRPRLSDIVLRSVGIVEHQGLIRQL